MTPVELSLLTSGIGAAAGIAGKIGWDWLMSGRKYDPGQPGRKCPDHETCIVSIAELRKGQIDQQNRLMAGDKVMEGMAKDIGHIKTDVAVLVTKIKTVVG